jgi:hypothetical protein
MDRPGVGASAPAGGPAPDADRADVAGLQAEGQRLHDEEQRLLAERARGVVDGAAHQRFAAALRAHRERLRRFRGGR